MAESPLALILSNSDSGHGASDCAFAAKGTDSSSAALSLQRPSVLMINMSISQITMTGKEFHPMSAFRESEI
ncbi:MAG: hypothetical protein J6K32_00990 [Clostridia bacterium]|nr:hypothetical protein [Clostridia bacterium]